MRYRHKKRGTEYVLIGIGKMQAEDWLERGIERFGGYDPGESVDMAEVAIYRSVTDPSEIWVRPREEFEDGRFEAIDPTQAPDELEVVAFLVDCPAQPTLEFANVHVPDSAEPLIRQSALTACQQEVERLREERNGMVHEVAYRHAVARAEAAEARIAELVKALEWYGEQARLARLIHSEGDSGRHALAEDGGKRARAALGGQSNEA